MVRTIEEVRAGRVTVTVTVDSAESDPPELDWAAVRAERDRLRGKVGKLGRDLDVAVATLAVRENQVTLLKAELDTAQRDRDTFKRQAYEENDNAAALRVEVGKSHHLVREERKLANLDLARRLVEVTEDRDRLAAQIGKVNGAVDSPFIIAAIRMTGSKYSPARTMADAIRDVRWIIGSPRSQDS